MKAWSKVAFGTSNVPVTNVLGSTRFCALFIINHVWPQINKILGLHLIIRYPLDNLMQHLYEDVTESRCILVLLEARGALDCTECLLPLMRTVPYSKKARSPLIIECPDGSQAPPGINPEVPLD